MSYEYTERDLLKKPHKYSFSKFQGAEFLKDYQETRDEILEELNKEVGEEKLLTFFREHMGKKEKKIEDIKPTKKFKTRELLKKTLIMLKTSKNDKEIYQILSKFTKKYEVFKRIFDEYNKDFRKTTEEHHNMKNYLLLALNLAEYHKKYGNLKFLNAMLKLNDLIISRHHKLDKEEQILAMMSLKTELEEVEKLAKKNKIEI